MIDTKQCSSVREQQLFSRRNRLIGVSELRNDLVGLLMDRDCLQIGFLFNLTARGRKLIWYLLFLHTPGKGGEAHLEGSCRSGAGEQKGRQCHVGRPLSQRVC